ncbi:xanthine dehydrogenase family protein molybdopterin-binding subunit [Jannaschia sp. CCS1]|uniref:xanthine dehydrogenase family protein molybdopterin-binding subunit n=1 Tax=Jannaschia sp. (strain CCS1) TaxID=290400 RepID=UPI000053B4F0|nr:xanthine dehydrogenase family protein molybdopterin-binding subunit [Jannaschia sp. CCS1]ABD55864.1 xanthine dehydrogenase, molybdenum binding subunit apoprotein [Jannaschia sp. CCS1]
MSGPLTIFDKPNSYIGKAVARPDAKRLLQGRGKFVDDLQLPRMVHAAFVRSPVAHGRILSLDLDEARDVPGVIAIYTGADLAEHVEPYVGVLSHLAGLRSAPQMPLAVDTVRWTGEPVVMIVATSRAIAEDAAALVFVDIEDLPVATDMERALDADAPVIHPDMGSNLAWERTVEAGDPDAAFARDDVTVVERTFRFGRHTGVTLETRASVVEYDPSEDLLTCHYSGQAPHMMQFIFAKHLGLAEENVRVISNDVGGSFGIKIHTYGDEIATAAAAKLLGRPVKFVADRLESFLTDIHARDHVVHGRIAVTEDGTIAALAFDDITGIGPYSMYPRTSAIEANQVLNLTGAPYALENYRANAKVVFQNKNLMCQYRAVGHPIAMAVADGLLEDAAAEIGMDVVAIRRRNLVKDDAYPTVSATGMKLDDLSHHKTLDLLVDTMDYDAKRAEHAKLRDQGIHRGLGIVSMIEVTNPSPMFYGIGGAPIASQDGSTIRLDAGGAIHVSSSVTEQGQGTNTILAQIAAGVFGVHMDRVKVTTGDTKTTPYGGGTWASRGAGIGGEATLQAAHALKEQVLDVAGVILQAKPDVLDIVDGHVVDLGTTTQRISLTDLARTVYYRGNELPSDMAPELVATRHFRVTDFPFVFTNAAMAAEIELDPETGFVQVLNVWAVEDCGRVINPTLVDEQIRGGVVQGIGGAFYEECIYSEDGQLENATMADYLVPMAFEMPDITVAHVETPTKTSVLGAKGAGEAGTGGAPAALMNAVNDALRPLGASIHQMPMTPERILKALGTV